MKKEQGFTPILIIIAVILIAALIIFLYFFFNQNKQDTELNSNIPPGIVTDESGQICETQDPTYCHESPDLETWTDDNLP